MKSISPIKFFTVAGFFIISFVQQSSWAACKSNIGGVVIDVESDCNIIFGGEVNVAKKAACGEAKACLQKEEKKQDKSDVKCEEAIKKHDDSKAEYDLVCSGVQKTKKGDESCESRINKCTEMVKKAFQPAADKEDAEVWGSKFKDALLSRYLPPGATLDDKKNIGTSFDGCIDFENDKTTTAQEKIDSKLEKIDSKKETYDEKLRDLKEKLTKLEEEKNKVFEEAKTENEKIDEERNKFEKEVKDTLDKLNNRKADKYRSLANTIAESATKLRNLQTSLIKKQEEVEAQKFNHLQTMKQFADKKVSQQCKSAVSIAKKCFTQSAKGTLDATKDKECASVGAFTGKGAAGAIELNKRILAVRDACFEQANMAISKTQFQQAQLLRTLESDISEKSIQIKELKEADLRKEKETEGIAAEFETEKSNEESNLNKKIEEFKKKVANIESKVNSKIQKLTLDRQRLELNISEFDQKKLKADLEIDKVKMNRKAISLPLSEATKSITKFETSRQEAYRLCCADSSKNPRCSSLKSSAYKTPDKLGIPKLENKTEQ